MPRRAVPAPSGSPEPFTPLPQRPNLELERKRAKQLLRRLRAGDAADLERARRLRIGARGFKLADAQFILAREYGFASWPRLVEYFSTWERHDRAGPSPLGGPTEPERFERRVPFLMQAHRDGRGWALATLAAFVPRFYGRTDEEIRAATLTEAEARLAVARELRFASWEAFEAWAAQAPASHEEFLKTPIMEALTAVRQHDRETLARVIDAHPELLEPPAPGKRSDSILRNALIAERRTGTREAREIADWLVARGAPLRETLNWMLIGELNTELERVRFLLDRGADPTWSPPSGVSVLEHAILRYWNPEPVELIASRVPSPRDALWIAAGLGDVRTMRSFLDHRGAPTEAARRDRPDLILAGLPSIPCRPDASDLDILWEAFFVAGMNQRLAAIDALLDAGFPINHAPWGNTLLEWADGNRKMALVDHLLKRGARPVAR